MSVIIPDAEMKKVLNLMKVKVPSAIRKAGQDAVAKTAVEGRKKEQRIANKLEMGKLQQKGSKFGVFSRWTSAGWVSTTRTSTKSGPFRMASFTWERVKKTKAEAFYTSQLANLWANPTKPYTSQSPLVGQAGRQKRWKVGESRPSKYDWSATENAIRQSIAIGIQKAEEEMKKTLKGEMT